MAAKRQETQEYFRQQVTPFIKEHCLSCHSNKRPTEAGVNFSPALKNPGQPAFTEQWQKAIARVKAHDMPPEYEDQPSNEDRAMFVQWLDRMKFLSERDPGPFIIRRLTKTEYGNTLRDLFGVDPAIAESLPEEVSGEGYLNSLSPLQLEQYLAIANRVIDRVVASQGQPPTKIQQRLFGKSVAAESAPIETVRQVTESLAKRAYRRPPTTDEVDTLLNVYRLGRRQELDHTASLALTLKAILVSPQFLFITPVDRPDTADRVVPLDDYQLASRLSYLLWATMPDDELMSLADRGALHNPDVLKRQVDRLLQDPRSRALFDGFGAQWLRIDGLQNAVFDPAKFPQMDDQLRSAMLAEARMYFQGMIRDNATVDRLIDSDHTFVNEALASIYQLDRLVSGSEMRRIDLHDDRRGGILGMPAVLAATSFPTRTSPVKRGVWVLEQILGEHVPAAPPDVPELSQQDSGDTDSMTLRERFEQHRSDPVCANCHKLLDPIGFGLENYDAIGRWRDTDDNGASIDASGVLPSGKRFSTPAELKQILAERTEDIARNFVEELLAYALCRGLEGYDEIVVDDLMQNLATDGYPMRSMVIAVVTSYPFTHRRIE